jgi:hypothetical protein
VSERERERSDKVYINSGVTINVKSVSVYQGPTVWPHAEVSFHVKVMTG